MKILQKLIESKKTVFTISDMKKIFWNENNKYINLLIQPLKREWILLNLSYGIRALKDYDIFELSSKLKSWSYISFETVLQKDWIIFQNYNNTIMLASDNSIKKNIWKFSFEYHKIKDDILKNPIGIVNYQNKYMIASTERAVCDMVYLYKDIIFDNIRPLKKQKLEEISKIYPKSTTLLINKLIQNVGTK